MPLESGTYISDLNASNPLGTGDPKAQGDDHLRLIKATLKNTFPNLNAAVTPTPTELNRLTGLTGLTGTGNLVASASPTFTGTVLAAALTASATVTAAALTATGTVTGNLFSGSGASLTALNATNLASGTVPDARFPATLPALNGSALTALNATNLASGTVADGRLSANVPLKDAANIFSATAHFSATWTSGTEGGLQLESAFPMLCIYETDASANAARWAHWAAGEVYNIGTGNDAATSFTSRLAMDRSGNFDFKAGTVTRANSSATEVGYAGSPLRAISAGDTTAATDAGKTVRFIGGSGQTFTLDGDPPTDSRVTIINSSGNGWTLAASGTLTHPTIGTGSRTMATGSTAIAHHLGSGSWYILATGGTIT